MMEPQNVLYLILGILVFNFVFELILDYLNIKNLKKELPSELSSIYSPEEWEKAKEYQKVNFSFGLLSDGFSLILTFVFILLGGFGWLYSEMTQFSENQIILPLLFFGL